MFEVAHASIAELSLDINLCIISRSFSFTGKQVLSAVKNVLPILVATFLLYEGLIQDTFFLVHLFFPRCGVLCTFFENVQYLWVAVIGCFSLYFCLF